MSNIPKLRYQKCCCCKTALRNKSFCKNITLVSAKTIEKTRVFFNNHSIQINDLICNKCRKNVKQIRNHTTSSHDVPETLSHLELSYTTSDNVFSIGEINDINETTNKITIEPTEVGRKIELYKAII